MALKTMQGLTPTITITVGTSTDLTEAANVYVSFKQGNEVQNMGRRSRRLQPLRRN